ncbi:MAG: oxidoreductase family protein, partial [Anaerolineaceae bacterium]
SSLEAITADWLTEVLRASGHLPQGAVGAFETTIIGAGIGFIGTVARLSLSYEGAPSTAPATVIAKVPSADPGSRAIGMMYGLYEREVRFYQHLGSSAGIPVPQCYHADFDANGSAIILLEELTGGRFGDQVAGSTPDEARLAIQHLARFHAQWWDSPRVAEHSWIAPGEMLVRGPLEMMYDACWQLCLARFETIFTPALRAIMPELGKRTLKAMDAFFAGSRTLCQGDYRPDNLFYGAPGSARDLVVCDWQAPTFSPGVSDLAYVITGSLLVDDRRKYELELLAEYHQILQEGGVNNYTLNQLETDYRGYFAGVIASGVILGATLPDGNERGKAMIEATFTRFMTAIDDLDSLALLPAL